MVLLFLSAGAVGAQPVMGRVIECRDRPQLLLKAGYVTPSQDAGHSGISARAMMTVHCDPGGREGLEVGFFGIPFVETRYPRNGSAYQLTARGSSLFAQYAGLVTERSLPGGLSNLHGVLGVGVYGGNRRDMTESISPNGTGGEQTYRSDFTQRDSGLGANVGLAFLFNATSGGAVHLDARQHLSPSGFLLALSAGILF
jgi:hypothetical protein